MPSPPAQTQSPLWKAFWRRFCRYRYCNLNTNWYACNANDQVSNAIRRGKQSTNSVISWRRPRASRPSHFPHFKITVCGPVTKTIRGFSSSGQTDGGAAHLHAVAIDEISQYSVTENLKLATVQASQQQAVDRHGNRVRNSARCSELRESRRRLMSVSSVFTHRSCFAHHLNLSERTTDYSPQVQRGHTRDRPCCKRDDEKA